MAKVNSGQDLQALALAGGTQAGYVNTSGAIAYTATSVTPTTSPAWTVDQWKGKFCVVGTVYGVISTNSATALTIDQWLNPATPTGAAGTTPAVNTSFIILGGAAPVNYMAVSANTAATGATDTTLPGEITTAAGTLKRAVATYAHTAGANTYTLTNTFTANASDTLPVTLAKIGTFDTLTPATGIMLHETLLSATATLTAAGDSVAVTQTVTM